MSDYTRIAIVTGATSGIGEATVRQFIHAGFAVVGNGRSGGKLEALADELGDAFRGVPGDAAEADVIDALFAVAKESFGRDADVVVVNAGRGLGGSVKDGDLAEFEDVLRINVTGALRLMQGAARRFTPRQEREFPRVAADIVLVGSVVGRQVSPFSAIYGSTKFAVHSLAEGLRREIGPKGVRVTCVAPGIVLSGFQKIAGYGEDTMRRFDENFSPLLVGDDIAQAILYVVNLPPHVHVSDIVVRPTRQDYP